jgi:hypothetical protein
MRRVDLNKLILEFKGIDVDLEDLTSNLPSPPTPKSIE